MKGVFHSPTPYITEDSFFTSCSCIASFLKQIHLVCTFHKNLTRVPMRLLSFCVGRNTNKNLQRVIPEEHNEPFKVDKGQL